MAESSLNAIAIADAPDFLAHAGETVTRYPEGEESLAESVTAIVEEDALPGTNEISGDGVNRKDQHGKRKRISVRLEMLTTQTTHDKDTWKVNGNIYSANRIVGADDGLKTVLASRIVGNWTVKPRI